MELPAFRYFHDPLAHGVIKQSTNTCVACGKVNGYITSCSVYPDPDDEYQGNICPWCVSSGFAHTVLNVSFNLFDIIENIPIYPKSIEELVNRTPGFPTWNYDQWLCHCSDCMVFMGDASIEDLREKGFLEKVHGMPQGLRTAFSQISEHYRPGGSPTFPKFKCRHCSEVRYYVDWT